MNRIFYLLVLVAGLTLAPLGTSADAQYFGFGYDLYSNDRAAGYGYRPYGQNYSNYRPYGSSYRNYSVYRPYSAYGPAYGSWFGSGRTYGSYYTSPYWW